MPIKEDIGSPGPGVIGDHELPCGCRKSNLGSLEEQPVLLSPGPSLQPNQTVFHFGLTLRRVPCNKRKD